MLMPHVSHTAVMWKSKYLNPQTSLGARNMKRSAVFFLFFLLKRKLEHVSRQERAALNSPTLRVKLLRVCVKRGLEKLQSFHLWTHKMSRCRYIELSICSSITYFLECFSMSTPTGLINTPMPSENFKNICIYNDVFVEGRRVWNQYLKSPFLMYVQQ